MNVRPQVANFSSSSSARGGLGSKLSLDESLDSDAARTHRLADLPFSLRDGEADNLATADSFQDDLLIDKMNDMHGNNKA